MPRPLPIELRSRAVNAYNAGEGTLKQISQRFSVSDRALSRWLAREKKFHSLAPKQTRRGPLPKIQESSYEKLKDFCNKKPDRTVAELARDWSQHTKQSISKSSMGRALLRAGLTLKKRHSAQKNATLIR